MQSHCIQSPSDCTPSGSEHPRCFYSPNRSLGGSNPDHLWANEWCRSCVSRSCNYFRSVDHLLNYFTASCLYSQLNFVLWFDKILKRNWINSSFQWSQYEIGNARTLVGNFWASNLVGWRVGRLRQIRPILCLWGKRSLGVRGRVRGRSDEAVIVTFSEAAWL